MLCWHRSAHDLLIIKSVRDSSFNFGPLAEPHGRPVQHVRVGGGEGLHQVEDEAPHPNQEAVAAHPGDVVVQRRLGKAARHKGGVINAHYRIKQYLLQASVKIRLHNL